MGEPAGIGGEITLKAWLGRGAGLPPFLALDDPEHLARLARHLGLDVPIGVIDGPEAALALFQRALPVLPCRLAAVAEPGRANPANAAAVIASIDRAVALAIAGRVAGVVTNPIHKLLLYGAGFRHPGHTEYLAELTRSPTPPVMMLASSQLRTVPITVHMPLREALATLTRERIVTTGRIVAAALRHDFGLPRPRLAVAGLNPHAGEGGSLGREEIDIIQPAIADLRQAGIEASGPHSPDALFHGQARADYDAALCMYHDQALIPIKTLDFWRGVNVTLGLPIVRTSPDHGTAFDIAGTGRAAPDSLVAALLMAAEIAHHRRVGAVPAGGAGG
ncbi:MAG: 4-hydroxythreonine-4-phosphate dehydrogenase PdxA [Alphaproteobacteria bacterium]|nr:4-hydroxythreonine-4-phosphate dehydrogenase PdxA [Alphaproteobacteria bacterium]